MKTVVFRVRGELHIVLHSEKPPSMSEWTTYVETVKKEERDGLDLTKMRTLVFTDGGGPNPAQRKMVNEVLSGRTTRVAMVTSSLITRTIASALAWFNPQIQVFAPDDVVSAFRFLGVTQSDFDEVWDIVKQLRVELGTPVRAILSDAPRVPGA